ncbi:sulfotransferase [bacterium]|nr:sulfotransferase [bacterium]
MHEHTFHGCPDRPWFFRFWSGMVVSGWLGLLARNRFDITPARIGMGALGLVFACINSFLGCAQRVRHGSRIARCALPDDPVFIIGHWRAGTTLVHELLARDTRLSCPDTYACFAPAHFLLTRRWFTPWMTPFIPQRRPTDDLPAGWDRPQEDEFALCNLGLPSPYLTMVFPNRPPAWPEYTDLRSLPPALRRKWTDALLRFYRCVLVERPGILAAKCPLHTCRIRILLDLFPRARFVHVTRDPFDLFSSTLALWRRLYRDQALQRPRYDALEERILATFAHVYECYNADQPLLGPGQLCEITYEHLAADPLGQMRRVYAELGIGDFARAEEGIARELPRLRAHQPARHVLTSAQQAAVASRWSGYIARYGYRLPG